MGNALNSLKFVTAKRLIESADPIKFRRKKLIKKLDEQIAMATAMSEGRSHGLTRSRRSIDPVTGQHIKIEVLGKIRPWWFTADTGKVAVQLRYGSKVIMLSKNRNAVEVNSPAELLSVLHTLKTAVNQGELDQEISIAADMVRARFKRK